MHSVWVCLCHGSVGKAAMKFEVSMPCPEDLPTFLCRSKFSPTVLQLQLSSNFSLGTY